MSWPSERPFVSGVGFNIPTDRELLYEIIGRLKQRADEDSAKLLGKARDQLLFALHSTNDPRAKLMYQLTVDEISTLLEVSEAQRAATPGPRKTDEKENLK